MTRRPSKRSVDELTTLKGATTPAGDLSEAVMRALAEESPDAIVVVDVQGSMVWVNHQLERLSGYGRAELLGKTVEHLLADALQTIHVDHRASFMQSPLARPMGVGLDLEAQTKGGATIPVEISLTPLETDRGDMVIATVRDITDRQATANQQSALRRVATLVAQGVPPEDVFAAVTFEVGRVLGVDYTAMSRYHPEGARTVVAAWARSGLPVVPVGTRETLGGPNVPTLVFETARPARIDHYSKNAGPAAAAAFAAGVHSAVGVPIRVEGQLWGLMNLYSTQKDPFPPGTEEQLDRFTQLVAMAIANAEAKAALTASRARIVTTADATRQRIERDLHDGAQQRLVTLALQLRVVQASVPPDANELALQLDDVATGLGKVLDELREIALGIHPEALTRGGLRSALKVLAHRSAVPVHLDVRVDDRLPEPVELAAYYVVSEALTNAVKHASASEVDIAAEVDQRELRIEIRDDGRGGATFDRGSGLVGLKDRVEALGGHLSVLSPTGAGTTIAITMPLRTGREMQLKSTDRGHLGGTDNETSGSPPG